MEPDLWTRIVARTASELTLVRPMLPTYGHLIVAALFPIYAGAHASLARPSSAARPPKKKRTRGARHAPESSDDEDEDEEEHKMEGLAPTDALLMPLFAGLTLAGLYFLIQWLQDPALLNKLLNGYFALFGVFSVSRLLTDALDIGHSLIFPRRYTLDGALYHVDSRKEAAVPVAGNTKDKAIIQSPLPGFLAKIPLSDGARQLLWSDRAMPGNKWTLRLYLHRVFAGKLLIGPHGMVGAAVAVLAVLYFNLVDKPWYLTNLMGFGFSYGALQLMSPTTFATGSLILGALFFYDIYFVFYTPMMVTVAKSLDVPIKLVFPRPAPASDPSAKPSHAMLGLGDVVLPGIMIGLALRFDLFLFYLRRQKRTSAATGGNEDIEKPTYHSLAGRWSDHFWTHSLVGRPLFASDNSRPERPFTFPKTYFNASLIGYIIGMLTTLGVMHVWGHAQPALLYLVPGVLGSLWLTALFRGEIGLMWEFNEATEEEDEQDDKQNQNSKSGPERSSFFSLSDKKAQERETRAKKALRQHVQVDEEVEDAAEEADNDNGADSDRVREVAGHKSEREVFSFSIEAPWKLKHPRSIRRNSSSQGKEEHTDLGAEGDSARRILPANETRSGEPPEKRVRRR